MRKIAIGPVLPFLLLLALPARTQTPERVTAITAPAHSLPPEDQSAAVTKFSFIVYGDTRGRRDGIEVQYDHSMLVDSMLTRIRNLRGSEYPVKFVLQSGDAVVDGRIPRQWNVSYVPIINKLTTQGDVSYFLVPGNHEEVGVDIGLRNYLDAVAQLIPPDGSPRRMPGKTAYSFGYGNTFVVALDANAAGDQAQFQWIKGQLDGLDRKRYTNLVIFCHQAPFSSGPHGGPTVEPETQALRDLYMPMFNAEHVRIVFSGHEHLFEHWVEHYSDASGAHRMDLVVSGGGGAPIYTYTGEPNIRDFLSANEAEKVSLTHLVKPSVNPGENPYHYLLIRVDGTQIDLQVIGVDWGAGFAPYRSNQTSLQDGGGR